MCGPHTHYLLERWKEWFSLEAGAEITVGDPPRKVKCEKGGTVGEVVYLRAGVNIVTGEPETNDGTPLTDEEKDTLRRHFVSEYPTWRDLWRKHIKPHFGRLSDFSEWIRGLDALLGRCATSPEESLGAETESAWRIAYARIGADELDGIRLCRLHDRHILARFLVAWRHPENRVGYWSRKGGTVEPAREPAKKAAFQWDAGKNSHAELMEAK